MTKRNTRFSPITTQEADLQLSAISYINTGYRLYQQVLNLQGFDTENNPYVKELYDAKKELVNQIGQQMSPKNDNLRFSEQAGEIDISVEDLIINLEETA
jgi:hypothetical protein